MSAIISIITAIIAVWFAFGLACDWSFMFSFRKRYPFFNRKPFTCASCLSFWLTLKILFVGWWCGVVGFPFLITVPILAYCTGKYIDNLTDPFQ